MIVGLSARGKDEKLDTYITTYKDKEKLKWLIEEMLDYKGSDIFGLDSYAWLLIGLEKMLEKMIW